MDLSEFVKSTILEVVNGVKDAQDGGQNLGCRIAPYVQTTPTGGQYVKEKSDSPYIQNLSFDVVLTSTDDESAKGGIGVFLGSVGLGGQREKKSQDGVQTRISFSVPILFPPPSGEPIPGKKPIVLSQIRGRNRGT